MGHPSDRKIGGPLLEISAYTMKHPPVQYPDFVARELLERFIKGEVCDLAPEAPLMSRVATAVQDRGD